MIKNSAQLIEMMNSSNIVEVKKLSEAETMLTVLTFLHLGFSSVSRGIVAEKCPVWARVSVSQEIPILMGKNSAWLTN